MAVFFDKVSLHPPFISSSGGLSNTHRVASVFGDTGTRCCNVKPTRDNGNGKAG